MAEEIRQGLLRRQRLTYAELAEIEQLAHICDTCDGLDIKLNWDVIRERATETTNDFLYYEQDCLVGYLPLFSFNSHEAEVSGMVHPDYRRQGIFTLLLHVAKGECERRGIDELFLIVEHASQSGLAFAESLSAEHHHAEYKMVLSELKEAQSITQPLEIREARVGEGAMLAYITAAAFEIEEEEVDWYEKNVTENMSRNSYIALYQDSYVGKLDVGLGLDEALIYGFGVMPIYQHRGYGRQILIYAIHDLQKRGYGNIALEVEIENKNAFALYQSTGFYISSTYDYYRVDV